jgi:tRNA(Ile)-lysidine synthase
MTPEIRSERSAVDFFREEADRLVELYGRYYSSEPVEAVCVAVSGGSDSMALLTMAGEWALRNDLRIFCLTVDHRLREESAREAEFVGDFCRLLGIRHETAIWDGRKHTTGKAGRLENLAREARYGLISEFCERNSIPVLFTGHTRDDQLETFEMRRRFGSSPRGLAGMSRIRSLTDRVKLLRPMLHFDKQYLEDFLRNRNISWKFDPMNDGEQFLRVACRREIMRWDEARKSEISDEIIRLGEIRSEIEQRAVAFLRQFCKFSAAGAVLDRDPLSAEREAVQAEVLRRIIRVIGGKKYAPSMPNSVREQIFCGKINTLGRCLLRVRKSGIFVSRENRINPKLRGENADGLPEANKDCKMTGKATLTRGSDGFDLFDVFL